MTAVTHKINLALFFIYTLAIASAAFGDSLPKTTITHEGIDFFASGERLVLNAVMRDEGAITEARCYFKTNLEKNYLYVSMGNQSGDNYQCILPALNAEAQILEYFFLIVNKNGQVIRSVPYKVTETQKNFTPQERSPVDTSLQLYVYSELEVINLHDTAIIDDETTLLSTGNVRRFYGLRAGVYAEESIPQYLPVMPGYFGGFQLGRSGRTMRPIKGFALLTYETPNIEPPAEAEQKDGGKQEKTTEPPDIAGENWTGYFSRTDMESKQYLTASITQSGSQVTIVTTKTGLGHYFSGIMNSSGDMLLYDHFDGEDWSTHNGPATSTKIKIYDYLWPPEAGQPQPPLNKIILYRPPLPPSEVTASRGTYLNKIAVSWNASSGTAFYTVYACGSPVDTGCTSLAQVTATAFDDTRKINGVIYYRIKACNEFLCSELSQFAPGYQRISIIPMLLLLQ